MAIRGVEIRGRGHWWVGLAAEKFLLRVLKRYARDRVGFRSKGCSAQVDNGTSRPARPGPVLVGRACVSWRGDSGEFPEKVMSGAGWAGGGGTCGRQGVAQRISFTLILR